MADVHLDWDDVDLVIGGETVRAPCQVVLRPEARRPEVTLRVSLPAGTTIELDPASRFSFRFVRTGAECEVHWNGSWHTADGFLEFELYRDPVMGKAEELVNMRFDLMNFPNFKVGRIEDRLDIAGTEWCVEIRPPRDSADIEALRSPLYRVTHSCTVRRADRSAFDSDVAWGVLSALQDALSFAAGRWVGMAFVAGFRSDGEVVWKCWGVGRLHPRLSEDGTWFDCQHGDSLVGVLSGALKLSKSAPRWTTFHAAVYWYVRSGCDRGGVDGGLVLLQACLERLGWQRFVVDGRECPDGRFQGLNSGSRVRCLLRDCGIPVDIPPRLAELAREAATRRWEDGPRAVVEARHLLAHASGNDHLPWYEVWVLARWYVESVLLRMLDYTGEYLNRTKALVVGDVERVPWA